MHGELMEFNSRLHSIINYKTIQIERLKSELVELRGPVSLFIKGKIMLSEKEGFYLLISLNSLINESFNWVFWFVKKLPPDLALNNQMDDTSTLESVDSLSVSNLNTALISIWIPSAFLRSESKSGSHHVYQVTIINRIETIKQSEITN